MLMTSLSSSTYFVFFKITEYGPFLSTKIDPLFYFFETIHFKIRLMKKFSNEKELLLDELHKIL